MGEDWLRGASEVCRRLGFETVVDENPGTFPVSFPLSQVAFYSGWYEESITGPFTRPTVEFMPGAFAYHLHSISAASLRTTTRQWVGPFLAKGVTATMGCVDEPYLAGTPNMAIFYARFVYSGFTFGEAAYASQAFLSWQATVVGDPLYRPFAKGPHEQKEELEQTHNKLVEWYYLRAGNFKMVNGTPTNEIISGLEKLELTKTSAVLSEKLAELYQDQGKMESSVQTLQKALKLEPTPQQRVRLMLNLGTRLLTLGHTQEAYDVYKDFLKACPDYPDQTAIHKQLAELAEKLGKKDEAAKFQHLIDAPSGSQSTLSKKPALRSGI
jgi:Tetratricopeptide repeat